VYIATDRQIHGSIILDDIWTSFLGRGATYTWERLIGEYIRLYIIFGLITGINRC